MRLPQRIVLLGDSITDGHSYPLLVDQALQEAGIRPPVLVNAGIGGDTAAGMRRRIGRDVLPHAPDLVTLSVGINDSLRSVSPADYERDVTSIVSQLKERCIPLLILTTSILADKFPEAQQRLLVYNGILERLAKENGYRLAHVHERMKRDAASGTHALEEDGVHPNYAGHRVMARALLDALGATQIPVPQKMVVSVMPGLIRHWKIRAVTDPKAPKLDAKAVGELDPSRGEWTDYELPEAEPHPVWWFDQERQRGFAIRMAERVGKANRYIGLASVDADTPRRAFINTGAHVQTVWVNGVKVFEQPDEWMGWHAGRQRIPVDLKHGRNGLVMETGPQFFLSITEDNRW